MFSASWSEDKWQLLLSQLFLYPFADPQPVITLLTAAFPTSPTACFPRDFADLVILFPSNMS